TGIPAADNTHQVAQREAPESRVVYVDNDPVVLLHAAALLRSCSPGVCDYIEADLRDPAGILDGAARTLDFTQPVALMLLAIMQFIPDEENPVGLVSTLLKGLPSGSYLVLSHPTDDFNPNEQGESIRRYNERVTDPATLRDREGTTRFFAGLEILEAGVAELVGAAALAQDLHLVRLGQERGQPPRKPAADGEPASRDEVLRPGVAQPHGQPDGQADPEPVEAEADEAGRPAGEGGAEESRDDQHERHREQEHQVPVGAQRGVGTGRRGRRGRRPAPLDQGERGADHGAGRDAEFPQRILEGQDVTEDLDSDADHDPEPGAPGSAPAHGPGEPGAAARQAEAEVDRLL